MLTTTTHEEPEVGYAVSPTLPFTKTPLDKRSQNYYTNLSPKNRDHLVSFQNKQPSFRYINFMLKREREAQIFQNVLERLGSKEARNIINIVGSILMGRTYLLEEFFRDEAKKAYPDSAYIYGDFANSKIGQQDALTFFLEWLYAGLKGQVLQDYSLPELKDKTKSDKETILKEIAGRIRSYLETHNEALMVLALDRMDRAEVWFTSLETSFLPQLLDKRFMLIMGSTGRVQIRVDFFVRSRVLELQPFTEADIDFTQSAIKLPTNTDQFQLKEISSKLLTLSQGLPGLFFRLLNSLNDDNCSLECILSKLDAPEQEQSLAEVLLDKILGELRLDEGEKSSYTQILKEMSILRRFTISDVHNMLTRSPDEIISQLFSGKTSAYFRDVLRKMRIVRCFDNDSSRGGYAWTENYRLVLEKGTRKWIGETAYLERQKKAVQLYVDLLKSEQGSDDIRRVYVEELQYHLSIVKPELEKALVARLSNQNYASELEESDKKLVEGWSIPEY